MHCANVGGIAGIRESEEIHLGDTLGKRSLEAPSGMTAQQSLHVSLLKYEK